MDAPQDWSLMTPKEWRVVEKAGEQFRTFNIKPMFMADMKRAGISYDDAEMLYNYATYLGQRLRWANENNLSFSDAEFPSFEEWKVMRGDLLPDA